MTVDQPAASASRPAPDKVTVFSTPWCGYCTRLKRQMQQAGIEYAEVDIEQDPSAEQFVVSVNNGFATVPTLHFPDGSTLTNPPLRAVQQQLARTA